MKRIKNALTSMYVDRLEGDAYGKMYGKNGKNQIRVI